MIKLLVFSTQLKPIHTSQNFRNYKQQYKTENWPIIKPSDCRNNNNDKKKTKKKNT